MNQQELTPFALFLQDYMWNQRPPLSRAGLAQRVNLPKQTISTWFVNGSIPRPSTVIILAKRLGLSARDLLAVAGYAPDRYLNETEWLATEEHPTAEEVFAYLRTQLEHDASLTMKERKRILAHVRELQEHYASPSIDAGNDSAAPSIGDAMRPKVRLAR